MHSTFRSDLFAGQVALVSGGTSGIGAAIGDALAAHGATVTVTGATAAEAAAAPCATRFRGQARRSCSTCATRRPSARCSMRCRGSTSWSTAPGRIRRGAEHDPETFDDVVDINLDGTMRLCAGARSKLAVRGGSIVNTASMLSFFGGGLVPGYSASKGGVAQLTKSLAIAYAAEKIRVNAVAPGWIATQLTAPLQADATRNTAILGRTPMGRWGDAGGHRAGRRCSCARRRPAFVTGAMLPVDGGYLVA